MQLLSPKEILPTTRLLVSRITRKQQHKTRFEEATNIIWLPIKMVAEKSGPSFASILTIVSIVIYTGGLVRIEVKFNKQKEKMHELESVVESIKTSNNDVARGKLVAVVAKTKQSINKIIDSLSRWKLRIVFESTP